MAFDMKTTRIEPLAPDREGIASRHDLDHADLKRLRWALYRSGPLTQEQVTGLFDMHRSKPTTNGFWIEFFIEALADFFLTRQGDQIILAAPEEMILLEAIGGATPVTDLAYRRLLLRLFLQATKHSGRYQSLVFDMVYHHLVHDRQRLLISLPRTAGSIDSVDLQLIRKLVFGAGGQEPNAIGRPAAAFLLRIDQAPLSFIDQGSWTNLFAKALSLHLIHAPEAQEHQFVEDNQAALMDQEAIQWLAEQLEQRQVAPGHPRMTIDALLSHQNTRIDDLPRSLKGPVTD